MTARSRIATIARSRIAAIASRVPLTIGLAALSGCAPANVGELATEIVEAPGATGAGFGDVSRAIDGVRGGGEHAGSLDVYSLDYRERRHLVLGFEGRVIVDGPGPDLAVFENGFRELERDAYFMDPVVVEVSPDGARWLAFPHDYVASDETRYEPHPAAWEGFAGVTPVLLDTGRGELDPLDPRAGGDAFDLAELGGERADEQALADEIRMRGARYVRLTSAAIVTNPDTGAPYPRDAVSDGADIDGVAARLGDPSDEPR
ncbi:MAG: LIC_13355 family lipoprotein [Sandaracinaceae bacterium]|nr:LIC_13355 family lipoprotein [Sandaracinaceae bacterium]